MHLKENVNKKLVLHTKENVHPFSAESGPVFLENDPLFMENGLFQEVIETFSKSGQEPCSDRVKALLAYYESYYMSNWQNAVHWTNLREEKSMGFRKVFTDTVREFHRTISELRKLSGNKSGVQLPFTDSDGERVEGELSLGFGLRESNNVFDSHRIVRPGQLHQGLFPVVINQEVVPARVHKGIYRCKEYLTKGEIAFKEVSGLPEILGPNGQFGQYKDLKPSFLDISKENIENLERKIQLDKVLEPLNEAKTTVRATLRALAGHSGNRISVQSWTPNEGLQITTVPVESLVDFIPYPKDSDYVASLDRMSRYSGSLERLMQLKKDGDKHLSVIEVCKDRLAVLEAELSPFPTAKEQHDFDKAKAKLNKRRLHWKNRMFRDLKKMQEELGVDLRYFKRDGEEDNDLPIVKAIKDHEYYKARGQAAGFFLGVNKVKKRAFATSSTSRPMLTVQTESTSDLVCYSRKREDIDPETGLGTLSDSVVKTVEHPDSKILAPRFPWEYDSVVFKEVKEEGKGKVSRLKPVKIKKVLSCSTSDDFFFMKKHVPTEASFKEGGRNSWEEVELDEGKQALHKGLMDFLDLHKDVMSYLFGGIDTDRKEPHGPTEKVEEAISILNAFLPTTAYARKDKIERLRDFTAILGAMKYGQKLRTEMCKARDERDALKEKYAEPLEEQEAFYNEIYPTISDEEKRVFFGVMAPYDDRTTTKKWVQIPAIYDYRDEPLDLDLVKGLPGTGEFVERPSPREPEGTSKTRNESENEADASEFLIRRHQEVFHEELIFRTQKRFNGIDSYCAFWQENGKCEGYPSNAVQNPWATYGDMFKDLFGKVYGQYFGQRPLGETGEVKEVVFSDGSIAIDSREQTHTEFGEFLGGTMITFLQHRQLQDVFFNKVWKDLTFQVWGENNREERTKDHANTKTRYTEESYFGEF